MSSWRIEVFLSPGFLIALGILLLNDFYLKAAFHNQITGKLSDFAGLFAISLAISAVGPSRVLLTNIWLSLAFLVWKTPVTDFLIESWNSLSIFTIARTVDYTDYIALLILPFASIYFHSIPITVDADFSKLRTHASCLVIGISVFAFTATTSVSDRSLTISNGYAVREKRSQIEAALRTNPLVSGLKVTDEGDLPLNAWNANTGVQTMFFDFWLAEKTCDSEKTAMQMMIREYKPVTNIEAVSIKFECHEYASNKNLEGLNQRYLQHAKELFERDILKDLRIVGSK